MDVDTQPQPLPHQPSPEQQHPHPEPSSPAQQEDAAASSSTNKQPVVRGARACTVCRAAKMKCVGAEDGKKQCQRCQRANVECVFEKHRRGRKPGSKLSEASKMLRRLEKGLNNAKLKSQSADSPTYADGRSPDRLPGMLRNGENFRGSTHFPTNELPPLNIPGSYPGKYASSSHDGALDQDDDDDEEEDNDRAKDGMFPAKLIRKENQRNSFFNTILNPEQESAAAASAAAASAMRGSASASPPAPRAAPVPSGMNDPITAGLITEDEAKLLFDMVFLRLNPFVNLFDPALHTVAYVRSKCPFLFTTLIMAGCKFFKHELFKPCLKLANEFAVRAFADGWKRVEVVQAFACMVYWREPDDNRTWTYIGFACRMAVELGLNRYHAKPPPHETEFMRRERRNRERTYLVLFVHDRSLSMQTGRHWMLPEDDLVRHSNTWHEEGGEPIRPEDVILAAFVQLRRLAAETTDMFYSNKGLPGAGHSDVNYEVVLRNCNGKLTQWMDFWQHEMERARGQPFHTSFLSFFRLYVRLFLNSFGIQHSMSSTSRQSPSLQALSACFTSAIETLQIVSKDFAQISMLRYSQDSITVMTAYSAVFLLKLLRSSNTLHSLHEGATDEIHTLISKTADAYHEASILSPASTSAAYHARFLRSLVANDRLKARLDKEKMDSMQIDPRLQGPYGTSPASSVPSPHQMYPQPMVQQHEYAFMPAPDQPQPIPTPPAAEYVSEALPRGGPMSHLGATNPYFSTGPPVSHATELDAHYWRHMFVELGYSETTDQQAQQQAQQQHGPPLPQGDQRQMGYANGHPQMGYANGQAHAMHHAAATHNGYGH